MESKSQLLRPTQLALVCACVSFGALTLSPPAYATPAFLNAWRSAYPNSTSEENLSSPCKLCHRGPFTEFNPYGWAFRENGHDFGAIESFNSDADPSGATNLEEINANTQPGWTEGANNIIRSRTSGSIVSENALPAELVAGMYDPVRVGEAAITVTNDWDTGFQAEGVIVNNTSNEIGSWWIHFEADFNIDKIWNAEIVSHTGRTYVIKAADWNKSIVPGGEIRFGFLGSPGDLQMPDDVVVYDETRSDDGATYSTQVTMSNVNDWGSAFQGQASIVNTGTAEINGWAISFDASFEIEQIWNARIVSHVGSNYVVANEVWNERILPNNQASFGFIASPGGSVLPVDFTVNGNAADTGTDTGTDQSGPQCGNFRYSNQRSCHFDGQRGRYPVQR